MRPDRRLLREALPSPASVNSITIQACRHQCSTTGVCGLVMAPTSSRLTPCTSLLTSRAPTK
eukprot:6032638-Amphidinium_carterae.1